MPKLARTSAAQPPLFHFISTHFIRVSLGDSLFNPLCLSSSNSSPTKSQSLMLSTHRNEKELIGARGLNSHRISSQALRYKSGTQWPWTNELQWMHRKRVYKWHWEKMWRIWWSGRKECGDRLGFAVGLYPDTFITETLNSCRRTSEATAWSWFNIST